jgi:hypothetical protein
VPYHSMSAGPIPAASTNLPSPPHTPQASRNPALQQRPLRSSGAPFLQQVPSLSTLVGQQPPCSSEGGKVVRSYGAWEPMLCESSCACADVVHA